MSICHTLNSLLIFPLQFMRLQFETKKINFNLPAKKPCFRGPAYRTQFLAEFEWNYMIYYECSASVRFSLDALRFGASRRYYFCKKNKRQESQHRINSTIFVPPSRHFKLFEYRLKYCMHLGLQTYAVHTQHTERAKRNNSTLEITVCVTCSASVVKYFPSFRIYQNEFSSINI